jgi:tetratricopeptide (TPR) repeat protein
VSGVRDAEGIATGAGSLQAAGSGFTSSFLPVARMLERAALAREDSDAAYFHDLLLLGELTIKVLVLEVLAGIEEDREGTRYSLEYRIVRADSIGVWADVLDDALAGPAVTAARESRRALTETQSPSIGTWQRRAINQLNEACRCLDDSHESLAGRKVALRHWVREFVRLRNRTRGHGAITAGTASAVCPTLESSIREVLGSAPAFQRPWAHLTQNLSGKFRVRSFGGDRSPFAYLGHESEHSIPDGCYLFLDKPRQTPLLFADPDLGDFFLPNGNFHAGSFEVLSYVTDDVHVEDGSTWTLPANARPMSETAGRPALDVVGNVFSNMPPSRDGYIRRPGLETELESILRDDRCVVVTLKGRGGVGKTSLALEVLHKLSLDTAFETIVWFSARDMDLLAQGPSTVRPDLLSTDDVARDFAKLMRPNEELNLAHAHKYFADCLSEPATLGPCLFVLDNFETIRDPAELYTYLFNAIRPPNKVLITTRVTRHFKADYPIEVSGMLRHEFADLVRDTAARLDISHLMNPAFEERLYEESDGHPYIAKVLLGEVAREKRLVSPKQTVATKDKMLDALFDRSFTSLSPAAHRVFLTLCSWHSQIPQLGLEAVLLRPGNDRLDVERALWELEQMSLVEVVRPSEGSEDFLSVPLVASIFGRKKLVTSPLRIAIEADLQLIRGFGVTTTTEVAGGLLPRIERMARAAARRIEDGQDVTQELLVLEYIATEYSPAWLTVAELQQYQLKDVAGAIGSTERYLESQPQDQDAWRRLAFLHRSDGNLLAEMNAWLQRAELCRPAFHELSSTANRLNGLLHTEMSLDVDEKRLMARKLRTLMEARKGEADATDFSRLAWLCLHDHDSVAAERWVAEGLALEDDNDYCLRLKRKLVNDRARLPS